MKFSLLYQNYIETREFTVNPLQSQMEETIYNLSIDKAIRELSRDAETCAYTLEVMKNPLKTAEEILYRQKILMAFLEIMACSTR